MTAASPINPKRKLRWHQYGLRTLLIGVTIFVFACSWFAVKMRQAKKQREAVAAIEKLGGTVRYFWVDDLQKSLPKCKITSPKQTGLGPPMQLTPLLPAK